jgi:hypothetical protein
VIVRWEGEMDLGKERWHEEGSYGTRKAEMERVRETWNEGQMERGKDRLKEGGRDGRQMEERWNEGVKK